MNKKKPGDLSEIADNLKRYQADKLKEKSIEELFFMLREGNEALSNTVAEEIRRRVEGSPAPELIADQARAWRAIMKLCQGLGARALPSGLDTVTSFIMKLYNSQRSPEGEGMIEKLSKAGAEIAIDIVTGWRRDPIPFSKEEAAYKITKRLREIIREGEQGPDQAPPDP